MNVEIGAEAAQFPEKEYINGIAFAVRWCTLTCEYLREFSKKFELTLMLFLEAWGKVIHEKKTLSKKSRDTVPLMPPC
jgi:hypothetical protein